MRVLVACEESGAVRRAFRAAGHNAWSCDLLPADDCSLYHIQGDVLAAISAGPTWDLMIAHPPCTYLTNSGVRWLYEKPGRRELMQQGAEFYRALWNAPIPRIALENPIMHCHAREAIGIAQKRQIVQPWQFGAPMFKATGFLLKNLPPLVPTDKLTPPKAGTPEHKAWSWVHRMAPGPDRAKLRSRTPQGIADAMAAQWG